MKIEDGTYKLTRDVKNPDRNLRNKRDWTCFDHWEEGDIFFVRTVQSPGFKENRDSWQEIQLKGSSRTIGDFADAFALIIFACEKVEETPSLYLKRIRREDEALSILDHMFTTNMITPEFLAACLKDIDSKRDEES